MQKPRTRPPISSLDAISLGLITGGARAPRDSVSGDVTGLVATPYAASIVSPRDTASGVISPRDEASGAPTG